MKKAIVTGSNGFIGSNVCKRLCADGIKVFAVVKDENENIDNIKNLSGIEIVYCELDEIETLADMISDRDIDVFYHFAWVGSAGSLRCDENVQLKNALWTARALRTADKMQCKKFVNAGSIMEKETYTAVYTQESKPGLPYIYGAGKLIARAICKPIANSLSIDLCWAVITNAYGVGVVALSTILSFALSFTLAIVSGAIFAIALPMFFDSDGLPEFTSTLKTSVSSMLSNLIIDLSCDAVYFSLSSFETEL
jgi:UDP-glucose 4-epimerase